MKPTQEDEDQFLADIITTAIEGGTGYWAAVSNYKWDCPPDQTFAILHEWDDDQGEYQNKGKVVDRITILKGIDKAKKSKREDFKHRVEVAELTADACEIDADDADILVQLGLFGEVVYG